jgi:hypothetical protein
MGVMKAKEIAERFDKSISWVYANGHHLGGSKIGGSWIFEEEEVKHALQRGKEISRSGHGSRTATDKAVHQRGRSKKMGGRGKGEAKESWGTDPSRHGIANILFQVSRLCGAEIFHENLQGEEKSGSEDM